MREIGVGAQEIGARITPDRTSRRVWMPAEFWADYMFCIWLGSLLLALREGGGGSIVCTHHCLVVLVD